MPDICSCGTHLVEDALFCHRCGRAQRELVSTEEAEVVEEPVAPASSFPEQTVAAGSAAPVPVAFHNSVAVRISFLVACVASVLEAMPFLYLLFPIWSASAGFFAVVLYRRKTGQLLSIRSGAKMGWITGVLNSVIMTVLFTVAFAGDSSDIISTFQQQLRTVASRDPENYARAAPFLESPMALATGILFFLLFLFVLFTGACVIGGAIGAHVTRKNASEA